jgi:pimeloyl-ACP methyl ester carboxylesterase
MIMMAGRIPASIWAAMVLAGILSASLFASRARAQDMSDDDFHPLRPPVLGYAMEWDAQRDLYRLVWVEDDKILATGDLETCQEALVGALEEAWGTGHPNLAIPTPGGLQFWADVFWFAGWRIQENVYTGHCRLLDPGNVRRAWGSREACRTAFERFRTTEELVMDDEHMVILLHGLGRTRESLSRLKWALRHAGFMTASITYPSTRRSLVEHADQLTSVLDRLEGVSSVSFVTHSLGGLVVRSALARDARWKQRIRVGRLVMLGPPNTGSALAEGLEDFLPAQLVLGPTTGEMVEEEMKTLPAPDCSFGIIAGGGPGEGGWNPLIEGDDDGIVSVEETRLEGADDFLLVRGLHTFFMNDPDVIQATVRFLETGHFLEGAPGSEEDAEPTPATRDAGEDDDGTV